MDPRDELGSVDRLTGRTGEVVDGASSMPHSEGLTTRVIREAVEWDAIQPHWDALHAACPGAPAALDWAWLRGWWAVYGREYGSGGLRVVTVWQGAGLVAALPLYVNRGSRGRLGIRSLRFISTGETEDEETCPEYLDLLAVPETGAACAGLAWQEVGRLAWDELEWLDLPAGSPLLLAGAMPPEARLFSRGSCPIADLTGGFAAYLDRLSGNSRQQARRLLREGERAAAVFELADADGLDAAFDDLVRLHQERWTADGKTGVFASARFVAFHRRLIQEWLPCGRAILARLSLGGEPVGVLYGFVTGQKFDFYQSGVRLAAAGSLRSPGNLAHLLLMSALAERGVTAYDFLRGAESYKERLATREHQLAGVRVWRPTLRGAAWRSIRFAGRIAGRPFHRPTGAGA